MRTKKEAKAKDLFVADHIKELVEIIKNSKLRTKRRYEYKKEDMVCEYKWKQKSILIPTYIGANTEDVLDRREGNSMLGLINSIAYTWEWGEEATLQEYQNLERIIKEKAPLEITKYREIMRWLMEHY